MKPTGSTMFLEPGPGQALLAHTRRRPFLALSMLAHAALLAALWRVDGANLALRRSEQARIEHARQERSIEAGRELTERARLERRVHDMARIAALLEQSADDAGRTRAEPSGDVQFSGHPRTPDALLAQATQLARRIDALQRDVQARELARLLAIPKDKALARLAPKGKVEPPPGSQPRPRSAAEAARTIEGLEASARAALDQRRRQLERRRDGVPVAADAASGKGAGPSGGDGAGHGRGNGPGIGQGTGQGVGPGRGDTGGVSLSTVLAGMRAFANPDLPDRPTRAYTAAGMHDFFDHGIGSMPPVDAATLRAGAGRIVGPGGAPANRIYVDAWYLIGPFEGKHGAGLFANAAYPPEQGVVLDAVYRGKDGRVLRWEYVDDARYPLIPPDVAEDAVYYGYTELMLDREQDLTVWVGADDDAQLWVNDRLVWPGGNVNKEWFFEQIYDTWNTLVRDRNLSEGTRNVHFRKGRNKLFFKLSNGPTRLFFSLVVTR